LTQIAGWETTDPILTHFNRLSAIAVIAVTPVVMAGA
jgi:hypothetical protein